MKSENNKIGLSTAIMILIGGMIGSAIFSLSGLTIFNAGPAAILSWVIAAIIMASYGLICSELAVRFPESGGVFVFPSKAFSENEKASSLLGYISTWGYVNANIVAIAFAAIYMATYLSVGFPIFTNMQVPIALISILLIFILNCIRFSITGKINNILVVILILCLCTYIFYAFISNQWSVNNFTPFFTQGVKGKFAFLEMVPTAMIAYGSIVAISFMASNVKNANRNIPVSVGISIFIVLCLYLGVIIATLGLINVELLKENPGMTYIPLYAAAFTKLSNFKLLPQIISISAAVANFTTMLVLVTINSKAIQKMSDNNTLPKIFSKTNKSESPYIASFTICLLASLISLKPSFTETIVSFAALFAVITISINCISLIHVKKKIVDADTSSFSLPFGITIPLITVLVIGICYIPDIISGGWKIWVYTIIWYVVGLVIYKLNKNK